MTDKIKYLYPFWGSEHLNPKDFLDHVIAKAFDGIEINIPDNAVFATNFFDSLNDVLQKSNNFILGLQQVSGIEKESPEEYLDKVLKRLKGLVRYRPNFINSHTGKDHYSFSDNCKIIEGIEEFSIKHAIPVYHEIHRGRFTFHSLTTLKYLEKFPEIKLVGDLSHWCVVSESMLQDQEDIIAKVIPHIVHLHARIGFEQAPQVNDPFAPEWEGLLLGYTKWWQQIVDYHIDQEFFAITPEFGPFPYMPQAPFTREPLSNQKESNLKMKEYLKKHLK